MENKMEKHIDNENVLILEHGSINTKRMIGDELEELVSFKPTFVNTIKREFKNHCFNLKNNSQKDTLANICSTNDADL
jgi:hypothetical protein